MSVDPLDAVTGQPYEYAGDNPINVSDPSGLHIDCGPNNVDCQGLNVCQYSGECGPNPAPSFTNEPAPGAAVIPSPPAPSPSPSRSSNGASVVSVISPTTWTQHGLFKPQNGSEWFAAEQGPTTLWYFEYGPPGSGGPGCPNFGHQSLFGELVHKTICVAEFTGGGAGTGAFGAVEFTSEVGPETIAGGMIGGAVVGGTIGVVKCFIF